MNTLAARFDLFSTVLTASSMIALRFAVKSMIEGGKNTFNLFRNLKGFPGLKLGARALWTTQPFARGEKINKPGMGEVTNREHTYKLAADVQKYRNGDPMHYDELVFAVRAVAWARLCMWCAVAAFAFKVAVFSLNACTTDQKCEQQCGGYSSPTAQTANPTR